MVRFHICEDDDFQFLDNEKTNLRNLCKKLTCVNPVIAEIGCWLGNST